MKIRYNGKIHTVYLRDSGTLDTEIEVDGERYTFSQEYAEQFRRRDGAMSQRGLRQLALDVLESAD